MLMPCKDGRHGCNALKGFGPPISRQLGNRKMGREKSGNLFCGAFEGAAPTRRETSRHVLVTSRGVVEPSEKRNPPPQKRGFHEEKEMGGEENKVVIASETLLHLRYLGQKGEKEAGQDHQVDARLREGTSSSL